MTTRLTPKAIALQGVGYVARLVALQGFWPAMRRALHGAGFGARPVWGTRPTMAATMRAPQVGTARPDMQASARPVHPNTTRPRR